MKKYCCIVLTLLFLVLSLSLPASATLLPGDVNGDGSVSSDDARLTLRFSAGLEFISPRSDAFYAADVNRNGEIEPDDARMILRASVQLETLPLANEFDYLRNGSFYLQGTMTDSFGQSLPLEMAVTPNSVYMLSNFEGAAMGILISNGTAYMIYPPEKSYLELSSAVMKAMGMTTDDLISSADLDYSKYDLANADATATETVNGVECTVYLFKEAFGSTRFFMNGCQLVRFGSYDLFGHPDTVNDIGYITDQVPADKINPPADYKEYKGLTGMFSFIGLLSDVVGEE